MKSKRLQLEGGCKHKLKLNGVALLEQAEQSPPSTPDEAIAVLKVYNSYYKKIKRNLKLRRYIIWLKKLGYQRV